MPDISMCNNRLCPSRIRCYRFMAIPSQHGQTYSYFVVNDFEGKCEYFWPIEEATGATRDENVGSPASEPLP